MSHSHNMPTSQLPQLLELGLLLQSLASEDDTDMRTTLDNFLSVHTTSENITNALDQPLHTARNLHSTSFFLSDDVNITDSLYMLRSYLSTAPTENANEGVFMGITSALMVITMISVATRFFARSVSRECAVKCGWGDLCVLIGLAAATLYAIYGIAAESGDACITCSVYTLTYANYKKLLQALYTSDVQYSVAIFFGRTALVSVFSLYTSGRSIRQRKMRSDIWFVFGVNVISLLVSVFVGVFQCLRPISFWKEPVDAVCYDHRVGAGRVAGGLGALVNFMLLGVGAKIILGRICCWNDNRKEQRGSGAIALVERRGDGMTALKTWEKYALFVAWLAGAGAAVASVFRAINATPASSTAHTLTANVTAVYLISLLEVDLVLILACMIPSVSTLVYHYYPGGRSQLPSDPPLPHSPASTTSSGSSFACSTARSSALKPTHAVEIGTSEIGLVRESTGGVSSMHTPRAIDFAEVLEKPEPSQRHQHRGSVGAPHERIRIGYKPSISVPNIKVTSDDAPLTPPPNIPLPSIPGAPPEGAGKPVSSEESRRWKPLPSTPVSQQGDRSSWATTSSSEIDSEVEDDDGEDEAYNTSHSAAPPSPIISTPRNTLSRSLTSPTHPSFSQSEMRKGSLTNTPRILVLRHAVDLTDESDSASPSPTVSKFEPGDEEDIERYNNNRVSTASSSVGISRQDFKTLNEELEGLRMEDDRDGQEDVGGSGESSDEASYEATSGRNRGRRGERREF